MEIGLCDAGYHLRAGRIVLLFAVVLAALGGSCSGVASGADAGERSPADMKWFREARFGMFVHWGLYSQLAGEWESKSVEGGAEWIQEYLKIPTTQYAGLIKTWNPTAYDPDQWVRLMKSAGVRYLCITSKHHDGFCLWPTQRNSDWNIAATPYREDLLKPLATACHKHGVTFCLYHSVLDWHHPDWPVRPPYNDTAQGQPDKERYKEEYLFPQLDELFSRYGKIGMIWLDGTWHAQWTSEDGRQLEEHIRSLQPDVVINNRSGYKPPQPDYGFEVKNSYGYVYAGDYISPEGEVPPTGLPGIDWETCQTMQLPNNWGYNRLVGFRSFQGLLCQLIDVASKGGNLLLNIGPHADGRILPQAVTCLEKFAEWMAVNAESIHGTTASPFSWLPFDGRCTKKGQTLYFHVFSWPREGQLNLPLRNGVRKAWLLADREAKPLGLDFGVQGVAVKVPRTAPDPIASVVAVEIEGQVNAVAAPVNLAAGKMPVVSSVWEGRPELRPEHITDQSSGTMWASAEDDRAATVALDLGEACQVIGVIVNDAPYRRAKSFAVEAKVGQGWVEVARGTAIGSNQRIIFRPTLTRHVRLVIHEASDTPTLADFQVIGYPLP